jgi:hypothetical protein
MLKEYLSEAVSLLTESMLGTPVPARAEICGSPVYCSGTCNQCGLGKGKFKRNCYVCGQLCVPGGCGWCWTPCSCGDYC